MIRVQNTLAESKRRQAEEIAQVYARAKEREAKLHEEVGGWCACVCNHQLVIGRASKQGVPG